MKKTLAKTVSYRIISFVVTAVGAYYFTRKFHIAAAFGLADGLGKSVIYFAHEILWRRFP